MENYVATTHIWAYVRITAGLRRDNVGVFASAQDHAAGVETFAEADAVTAASTVRNAVADCQHALDASGGRRMSLTRPPSSCSCDGSASSWRLDVAATSFQHGMLLHESSTVQYQLTASQRTVETRTESCGRR